MLNLSPPAGKIPVVGLSPEAIPQRYQFEAWHQAAAPLFDTVPLKASDAYSCSCTSYLVDNLIFTHTRFDKMGFVRSSKHLSGEETDYIALQYYQSGQIQGALADGTPLLMRPDRISIQDFAQAYSGIGETTNNFGVIIPRYLISAHSDIFQHHSMFSWTLDSPQGRLLSSALSRIWRELPDLTQSDAPSIASALVGLLNGLLSTQRNDEVQYQLQQMSLKAMQDYLQANLQRPNLDVEHLCEAFHCSRSTVYRLFQPLGGVKSYLHDKRLERCFRDLQNNTTEQTISAIARRWGFLHASNFTRRFKQRYGISPSELSANGLANQDDPKVGNFAWDEEVNTIKNWLESRT